MRRFSPPQRRRSGTQHSDTDLNRGNESLRHGTQGGQSSGSAPLLVDQLLKTRVSQRHYCDLGSRKNAVSDNEQQYDDHLAKNRDYLPPLTSTEAGWVLLMRLLCAGDSSQLSAVGAASLSAQSLARSPSQAPSSGLGARLLERILAELPSYHPAH